MRVIKSIWNDFRDGLRATAADIKGAVAGWRERDVQLRIAALTIVIVIGAAVRIAFLSRPMLVDESVSYLLYASRPFAEALSDYSLPNNHLLNTALMRISVLALGNSPLAVRFPALAAGIAVIGAAYVCFKTLYNPSVGLLGSALVAGASAQINYSSQGRGYSLITLMFLLMITLACRLRCQWNTAEAIGVGLLGVVAMYAVPTGLYAVAIVWIGLGLALLMDRKVWRDGRIVRDSTASLGIMGLLTVLLYLPPVLISGWKALAGNAWVLPMHFSDFTIASRVMLEETWAAWTRNLPVPAAWLIAGLALTGLVGSGPGRASRIVPVLGAALGLAAILTAQNVAPFVRVWTFLQPLVLGAAAGGLWVVIDWLIRRPLHEAGLRLAALALPVSLSALMGLAVLYQERTALWDIPEPLRRASEIATELTDRMQPGDVLTGNDPTWIPVAYYLSEAGYPEPWTPTWMGPVRVRRIEPEHVYLLIQGQLDGSLQVAYDLMGQIPAITPSKYYTPVETMRNDLVRVYIIQRKP